MVQSFRSALFLAIVCSMFVPNASEAAERSKPVPQADPLPDAKKWDKLRGTFYGRTGDIKDMLLREGGGTAESEAAVAAGLKWIARQQEADGRWRLNGNFPDSGPANDIAATAFGLLPLLGTGHTHKAGAGNPYAKSVEKGLAFLVRKQNQKTGDFGGGGMYAHALATIALCEAYGLSKDAKLRRPAQLAVNHIVLAQHSAGGWRYSPGQQGDTSVTGFQISALKTGQMAGLDVPAVTFKKAQKFLDQVQDVGNDGYCYIPNGSATPSMSAVGLLCRQYLQSWGPENPAMAKGIDNSIGKNPPGAAKNMYYHYYATQVMHHFGGEAWKGWNEKMRDHLIATQEKKAPHEGSWDSRGEHHPAGRLMQTSLCILTLEVYYRHVPLGMKTP